MSDRIPGSGAMRRQLLDYEIEDIDRLTAEYVRNKRARTRWGEGNKQERVYTNREAAEKFASCMWRILSKVQSEATKQNP